jgi:ribosomal-protein-alanine N-acetyltransferase
MIIGIDCSSKEGGLATSEKSFYPLHWVEDITAKIDELNINSKDVEKILITHGPGSFTSLRVGLVTVQGLALPLDIPILAYSTFLAMIEDMPYGELFPLISARSKVVYAAYYRKNRKEVKEVFKNKVFSIDELICYLDINSGSIKKPIIFGEGAQKNRDLLNERGYSISSCPDTALACSLFKLYKNNADCIINPEGPLYLSKSAAIRKRTEAEIEIREMKEEDIKDILEIEKDVFPEPWPYEMFYIHLFSDFCLKIVAVYSGNVVGYLIGAEEGDKFHLNNIAISRGYWRKGFGTKLLSHLLEKLAKDPGINFCYLEHRIKNEAAFELYKSLGFTYQKIKKDYYRKGEDAVVMGIKC